MLFYKIEDIKKPFQNGRVFIEMKMLFKAKYISFFFVLLLKPFIKSIHLVFLKMVFFYFAVQGS